MSSSDNNIIQNNLFLNCSYGIYLISDSANNIVIRNAFEKCGLGIGGDFKLFNHTIRNNTVNGKPLYYYKDTKGIIVPEDAGQVIIVNCSNMILKNTNVSSASIGIFLRRVKNSIIENNICDNNIYGIFLDGDYNTIAKNTCNFNKLVGISLIGAYNPHSAL